MAQLHACVGHNRTNRNRRDDVPTDAFGPEPSIVYLQADICAGDLSGLFDEVDVLKPVIRHR